MEISREESWHISQIMKERGVGHCQFCKDLLKRLEEFIPEQMTWICPRCEERHCMNATRCKCGYNEKQEAIPK